MLLLPALLLMLAAALGIFQLGIERIWLEVRAFEVARSVAIGFNPLEIENLAVDIHDDGRLRCVSVSKSGFIKLETTRCMIPYGG